MGYAILHIGKGNPKVNQYGVIKLSKFKNYQQKLHNIQERISQIIQTYSPDELAIEAPFYGKNPQSMLKLGRAQGVVIGCALSFGLPFTEYAPKKVKQAVTGNGNASKEQIAKMLGMTLEITHKDDIELDATDALGVALCHYYQQNAPKRSNKSWEAFLNENQERLIDPKSGS